LVPVAQNMVRFSLEGEGRIIGVGNGDPSSHEPDTFVPGRHTRTVALDTWRWRRTDGRADAAPRPEYAVGFDDSNWNTLTGRDAGWPRTIEGDEALAIYRASFTLNAEDLRGDGASVRFSGCDDEGWYFVNGHYLGETHEWNAAPAYDISPLLRPGENVVAVLCRNGGGQGGLNPGVAVDIALAPAPVQWSRSLFNGLAQVIVQSTREAGEIRLAADADGLAPATCRVRAAPATPPPEP
jgi:beta-galactosidase